ncbi:hypothetical protein J4479_03465 [Candidatus Woesearchaeota archaeon]|nr:hypothetical protein [Candidatus Woesearchaeota archaeon]
MVYKTFNFVEKKGRERNGSYHEDISHMFYALVGNKYADQLVKGFGSDHQLGVYDFGSASVVLDDLAGDVTIIAKDEKSIEKVRSQLERELTISYSLTEKTTG